MRYFTEEELLSLFGDQTLEDSDNLIDEEFIVTEASDVNNTYYFRDHLQYPIITPILEQQKYRDQIIEFTGRFMDVHSEQLSTAGPCKMFTFADKEINELYGIFGVNNTQLVNFIDEMFKVAYKENESSFHVSRKAPHKVFLTAIIVEAYLKKYDDVIECCKYIMAFMEYPPLFRKYWSLGVNEDVMAYTIEHLPNKFKIKKMDNLRQLLKYDMDSVFRLCEERLKTQYDFQYVGFIQRARSQLNATIKKISQVYYDNIKDNVTIHKKGAILDDGNLADQEGQNSLIVQKIDTTYNKILTSGINARIVKIAAEGNSINPDILLSYLNQIYASKGNRLYKFIENVITAYMMKNPTNTSLGSGEFFNFGLILYRSIGTSKDPLYQEIREILDFWMNDIINITKFYQNKGTIINYTRGVFNYTIMMINHHN